MGVRLLSVGLPGQVILGKESRLRKPGGTRGSLRPNIHLFSDFKPFLLSLLVLFWMGNTHVRAWMCISHTRTFTVLYFDWTFHEFQLGFFSADLFSRFQYLNPSNEIILDIISQC